MACNSLFGGGGGVWGEAELILGFYMGSAGEILSGPVNLFHEFGDINALSLGSKGA